jgi:hypothetical protein
VKMIAALIPDKAGSRRADQGRRRFRLVRGTPRDA